MAAAENRLKVRTELWEMIISNVANRRVFVFSFQGSLVMAGIESNFLNPDPSHLNVCQQTPSWRTAGRAGGEQPTAPQWGFTMGIHGAIQEPAYFAGLTR